MVGRRLRGALALLLLCASGLASAQIVLYERENFGGRSFGARGSVPNLDETGFNDRASSVEVRSGRWQLCDDAYFRGRCVTLEGGGYQSLREMGLEGRVSSIREIGGSGERRDGPYDGDGPRRGPGGGYDGDGPRRGPGGVRAILFSGQNLSGQALVIEAPGIPDLDRTQFNDRARSLRVEGGEWVFCSDSNFRGNCQTYGPGDYPSLPSGQSQRISSGRVVGDDDRGRRRGR